MNRREFLKTAGGLTGGAAALSAAGPAAAQQNSGSGGSSGSGGGGGGTPDFGSWFSNVGNFDGSVVDATGKDTVTVKVGAKGNGGHFAFAPPAIHIDAGATVVWEWTGNGAHNVVGKEGKFKSGSVTSDPSTTFKHTFESDGIYKYFCRPHKPMGMKGAIVVGTEYPTKSGGGSGGGGGTPDFGGWLSNVGNFDGTVVDARGKKKVTVKVGAQGNGGHFAFAPPAVHIDAGATIVWEWTGKGSHNVVGKAGKFKSGPVTSKASATFTHTFKSDGMYKYYCQPHKTMGMKGAIVVGTEYPTKSTSGGGEASHNNPRHWGVPFQPHFVGIATTLAVFATLVFSFFTLKYGESANTKGGNN